MVRVTTTSPAAHADGTVDDVTSRAGGGHPPADLTALVQRSWEHAAAACRAAEDLLEAERERDDRGAVGRLVRVLDACGGGQAALGGALRVLRDGGMECSREATPWSYGAAPLLVDGPRGRE